LKYYLNDGKKSVSSNKPEEINLELALEALRSLPNEEELKDNFIGFTKSKEETIQFIRKQEDDWIIDIPQYKNGKYCGSENKSGLTTGNVIQIVSKFFLGEDWKVLLDSFSITGHNINQTMKPSLSPKCPFCGTQVREPKKTWKIKKDDTFLVVGLYKCPQCYRFFKK